MTMPKTILLVDDEKPLLMSLSEGLSMLDKNLYVLTAENGEEAIEILNSSDIDLIITDLKMPKKDGFDLLMYKYNNCPHVPAIVMTAQYGQNILRRLDDIGVYCMEKPLDFDELANKVFSLLEKEV
ncbi:MAG: response regulator [Nitrospirae bacterium]|nr:response regulator [Nitrospirota bacterium]